MKFAEMLDQEREDAAMQILKLQMEAGLLQIESKGINELTRSLLNFLNENSEKLAVFGNLHGEWTEQLTRYCAASESVGEAFENKTKQLTNALTDFDKRYPEITRALQGENNL